MNKYSWNSTDYKQNSQAQQKWAVELLGKISLSGSEDVLDLGCGDGKVTAEIANLVIHGSVVGIDYSRPMIELAKQHYSATEYAHLSFLEMDATQLSFEERFDVVFSNAALHWVKNHKPVVEGMYRSLKSGGKILLQMGGQGNAAQILSVINGLQSQKEWQPYFENFEFPYGFLGTEEYTSLLNEAGFSIKRVELIPKDMEQDGQHGLEGWIRTTWMPYTDQVPEEKREQFIRELSSNYIKKFPLDSEGKVHVAMVRIEVEAEKLPG
ncbi:MAG: methyltransferase domain-containing protein [Gimesia sp.]|nr:methyltransferase domain-containing protein [Gimesia sp.]